MMSPMRMSTMLCDLDRRMKAVEARLDVKPGGDVRGERPQAEVKSEKARAEAVERLTANKVPSVSAEPPPAPEAPPPPPEAVEAPAGTTTV